MEDDRNGRAAASSSGGGGDMQDVPVDSPRAAPPRRQVSNIDAPKVKTGIFGASSNLVNAIVGAGIIGIPYAIRESGFVIGLLLLVLVSYFTDKSLRMIVNLASFHPVLKNLGVLTFEDLMSIPFGRWGSRFILASMFILAYGAMVAYLLIVKDTIPTVFGLGNSFVEREVVMTVCSLVIMVPLSMLRDISQLAFTSLLSVIADVVLIVIVLIHAPVKESVSDAGGFGQVLKDNWVNGRVFIGLGVLSTAMACQHSAFLISGSLEDPTADRWAKVTHRSLFTAGGLSALLGVFGYLGYLSGTRGDILLNMDEDSSAVNGARTLLAITMFFTYPMESFVARHVIVQLFFSGNMDNTSVGQNGEQVPERKTCGCLGRREKVTFLLYLAVLVPALIVDDLGPVLSLTGSLGASCIAYIAPGLVYLGMNGEAFLEWSGAILQRKGFKSKKSDAGGEIELPVVGDASATMQTSTTPELGAPKSHPWWWCLVGMPIWVSVASTGDLGSKAFLTELGVSEAELVRHQNDADSIGPRPRDYIWSIVFVIFGIIAAVFGVISNVYVQVNDVFFSPH
jgi:sodium-coupled neutral amino acid transporter 11